MYEADYMIKRYLWRLFNCLTETIYNLVYIFNNKLNFFYFQESEIVEVLWKQDVDLGYSLSPPKPLDVKKTGGVNADDENEKLRALQELKDEKVCYQFHILFGVEH